MAAPKTTNLGLNKVDRTSPSTTTFNTKTLIDDNADLIDAKFGTATDGHKHDGTAGNGPKLGSSAIADGAVGTAALGAKSVTQAKIGDKVVAAAQLADGAATDTVIGSRTISDTVAPTADSGAPTTLFGWLANMIKQITGKTSWRTTPAITLEATKAHVDATAAHGSTSAATAGTIMQRDASGRAKVAAPSAADDIARKDTVDAAIATAASDATTKSNAAQANLTAHIGAGGAVHADVTTTTDGFMIAADKVKLDGIAAGAGTAGSATDSVIGSRTISDTTAPTADAGTPTTLFGWLANMIKQITGKTSWRTAPAITLEAAKTQIDAAKAKADAALPASSYTAADVLAKILTVDTDAAGVNASTLQGISGNSVFAMRTIPSGTDLNAVVTPGTYNLGTSSSYTNHPGAEFEWAILDVSATASGYIVQRLTCVLTPNPMCFRARTETVSAWSSWRKMWHEGTDGVDSGLDADRVRGYMPLSGYSNEAYIPLVNSNGGTLEIGQYIDFHKKDSVRDYDARLYLDSNTNALMIDNTAYTMGFRINNERLEYWNGVSWMPAATAYTSKKVSVQATVVGTMTTLVSLSGPGVVNTIAVTAGSVLGIEVWVDGGLYYASTSGTDNLAIGPQAWDSSGYIAAVDSSLRTTRMYGDSTIYFKSSFLIKGYKTQVNSMSPEIRVAYAN
ncbi:pyocin knob domain-containing protein [Gorillibacterium sp. sgz500922]|uniref:pyocin knob domain-containing protein n=1 Tax=Gorillibacterium sp. sgz500922 TaxID=3446694 RepID=UPI003F670BF9